MAGLEVDLVTNYMTISWRGWTIKYHKADELTTEVYIRWIDGNLQTVYSEACKVAEIEFNALIRKRCKSQQKLDRVIEIFETFTKLEVQFWSRCI
ncbi:hypothetical protein DASC09_047730 [Saccharomycopsis crataegensis]|uniref:Uncharacterized protein n=1 Tax=Saccharomycopsis crataegensis TaxID=43959 RepID=A0AAV5QRM6_9ASCO|nr:hypothetical protein DASC09_047730 [Saccharomycopsis crataegensis]